MSRPFRRLDSNGDLQWDRIKSLDKGQIYKQVIQICFVLHHVCLFWQDDYEQYRQISFLRSFQLLHLCWLINESELNQGLQIQLGKLFKITGTFGLLISPQLARTCYFKLYMVNFTLNILFFLSLWEQPKSFQLSIEFLLIVEWFIQNGKEGDKVNFSLIGKSIWQSLVVSGMYKQTWLIRTEAWPDFIYPPSGKRKLKQQMTTILNWERLMGKFPGRNLRANCSCHTKPMKCLLTRSFQKLECVLGKEPAVCRSFLPS